MGSSGACYCCPGEILKNWKKVLDIFDDLGIIIPVLDT